MEKKPIILVTGSTGQLGEEIRELSGSYPQYDFIFAGRLEMPLDEPARFSEFFKATSPDFLINTAALTAVDKAESESELAFSINGIAPGIIAALCREVGTRMIQISTDYVFDGRANRPYQADDLPAPQSVYGSSKLEGESLALKANPDVIIIRTSWVYSGFGRNFLKTMMKLMTERDLVRVVDDQIGTPTYAADLAAAILQIINTGKWIPGIYHYTNKGQTSWFGFAKAIKDIASLPAKLEPIPTSEYPTPAKRPGYSVLDTSKIEQIYGLHIPDWEESVGRCIRLKFKV